MKKWIFALPIMVFPYLLLAILGCIFSGFLIETLFQNNIFCCILALAIFAAVALLGVILIWVFYLPRRERASSVALLALLIKLVHIPAYVIIFVLGLLFMITIFTVGFSLAFVLFDLVTIFLSGSVGMLAVWKFYAEERINLAECFLHSILQFVFCLDVINAVIVYVRARGAEREA